MEDACISIGIIDPSGIRSAISGASRKLLPKFLIGHANEAAGAAAPRFITTGAGIVIDRSAIKATISTQRQSRHVIGSKNYQNGKGYFGSTGGGHSPF
jgi:hypothetical protein